MLEQIFLFLLLFTHCASSRKTCNGERHRFPPLHRRGKLWTRKPLRRRAPLGSFTEAWRACAPEAAISSTACDGQLTCTRFFQVASTRLETRTQESNRWHVFLWVLEPANAFKALACTSAQATVYDLESGSRKGISVWGSMSVFCLSVSPLFFPLFSLSPSPSPSLTPSFSALVIFFIFIFFIISVFIFHLFSIIIVIIIIVNFDLVYRYFSFSVY